MKDDLVGLSDYCWQRTSTRLNGLGDEEYLWEPVAGCWTIRDKGDGIHHADGAWPPPDPPPFTTLAWRIAHVTDCYGADRNAQRLRVDPGPVVLDPSGSRPATAEGAVDLLDRAHARWRRHLTGAPPESLAGKLGPSAGPFADSTVAGFVLHMLDEFIHHGAEIAMLRDLFAATRATGRP